MDTKSITSANASGNEVYFARQNKPVPYNHTEALHLNDRLSFSTTVYHTMVYICKRFNCNCLERSQWRLVLVSTSGQYHRLVEHISVK